MGTIQNGSYISQYNGNQIDEALGKALNPDTAPTADSANLITSGGVYTAENTTRGNFAPIETTSTASQAYAVGDYLVYNDLLYRVTAAIAQGETITEGTNVTATTVGGELVTSSQEVAQKAPLASPALTGTPTAPTPAVGDNSTKIATTEFVAENAAPAGYGLGRVGGKVLTASDDLNEIKACGFYSWYSAENMPVNAPVAYGSMIVSSMNSADLIQTVFDHGNNSKPIRLIRSYSAPNWLPWEYVNPPLEANVEYRTTERFLGKPVYVKYVDTINNGRVGSGTFAHGIANINVVIEAKLKTGYQFGDKIYNNSLTDQWTMYIAYTNSTVIDIFAGTSAINADYMGVLFKYTKTTD